MRKIAAYAVISVFLLLAACGNSEGKENPTGAPTATVAPTETVAPTATTAPTATAAPTATTAPTATAAPTATTAPTATPVAEPTGGAQSAGMKLVLGEYLGMVLYNVTQAEVDARIHDILYELAERKVVDRPAELGDITNINYVGKLDGVAFEGGTDDSEEGTDLELGSGSFIPGFEEGLVGVVAGEVRDLTLTFPESYHSASLAGQTVVFTVTVNEVKALVYPELTDEYVSENLSAGMTAEEFRQSVYEELRWESLTAQAVEQLMNVSAWESYPADEIEAEATEIIDMYISYAQYYGSFLGADEETMLQFLGFANRAALEEYAYFYAEYALKTSLLMETIAEKENIALTEAVYEERALEYAYANGYTDIVTFENDYGVEEIESAILYDLVLEYIVAKAIIVEEN